MNSLVSEWITCFWPNQKDEKLRCQIENLSTPEGVQNSETPEKKPKNLTQQATNLCSKEWKKPEKKSKNFPLPTKHQIPLSKVGKYPNLNSKELETQKKKKKKIQEFQFPYLSGTKFSYQNQQFIQIEKKKNIP